MARLYTYYTGSGSNTPQDPDSRFYFDYTYTQDKTNNKSTLTVKAYIQVYDTDLMFHDSQIYAHFKFGSTWYTIASNVYWSMNGAGTKLLGTKSVTFNHNNDGTLSGSFQCRAGGGTYSSSYYYTSNITLTFTTIPRYASITSFSAVATGLQSIDVTWNADVSCDSIQYRLNGGSWVTPSGTTYPTFTISGLSPETQYGIEIQVRRTDSQLWTASSQIFATTLAIAKITSGPPNFNIGNTLQVTFNNPSGATTNLRLETLNPTTTRITRNNVTSPCTITFTQAEINALFGCTPNSNSLTVRIVVDTVYNGTTYNHWEDGTASVVNQNPTFSAFTYLDTNSSVVSVTGSNQYIVKNKSTLRVTISSANKMVAKASASPVNYLVTCDDKSVSVNYSSSNLNVDLGVISNAGTKRLSVKAIDSRGNSTTVYYDITIYDYNKPVINVLASRLNDFENQTTIQMNGTFSLLTINGSNKNTIGSSNVKYRYAQAGQSLPSTWTNMTRTLQNNTYSCTNIVLNLDNTKAFNFEFKVIDSLDESILPLVVDVGQELMYLNSDTGDLTIKGNFNAGGNISGKQINGTDVSASSISGTNVYGTNLYSNNKRVTILENADHSSGNANDITQTSIYMMTGGTASNMPTSNWMFLFTLQDERVGRNITQLAFDDVSNRAYIRNQNGNGTWSAWKQLAMISYGTGTPGTLMDGEIYIKY